MVREKQRGRLVRGLAAALVAGSLLASAAAVAADTDAPEPRDVNVGKEAQEHADDAVIKTTGVVALPVVENTETLVPASGIINVEHRDDRDVSE